MDKETRERLTEARLDYNIAIGELRENRENMPPAVMQALNALSSQNEALLKYIAEVDSRPEAGRDHLDEYNPRA